MSKDALKNFPNQFPPHQYLLQDSEKYLLDDNDPLIPVIRSGDVITLYDRHWLD